MKTNLSPVLGILPTRPPGPLESARLDVELIESGAHDMEASVKYEADFHAYDSGKKLLVVCRRNEKDPDALENKLLDCVDDRENEVLDTIDDHILPNIVCFYHPATRITLETIEGEITTTVTKALDAIIDYLPIPLHLFHIPTIPITELERFAAVDMDVDCVKWCGQPYAFKKTGTNLEGTLQELTILDRLSSSPHILKVEAIVVNQDNTIRGFLSKFMLAKNLENVFRIAWQNQGLSDDSEDVALSWPLKLSWACQITQAVVNLHAISAYNGDLKPQNVLLDSTGQVVLIDFLPIGYSEDFAAPEVLEKCHDHKFYFETLLTAPTDIYSLGLVLWAVAEEKWRGVRPPVWRDGMTPGWYRDIVQQCLSLDPEMRPSSVEVLSLIRKEGS